MMSGSALRLLLASSLLCQAFAIQHDLLKQRKNHHSFSSAADIYGCANFGPADCETVAPHCSWHQSKCQPFNGYKPADYRCTNGSSWTECLDVEKCGADGPVPSKEAPWAVVFTHTLEAPFKGLLEENIAPWRELAKKHGNIDILLMVPKKGAKVNGIGVKSDYTIRAPIKEKLKADGIKVYEVPWNFPPNMKYVPETEWCGGKDLIRLHILGLEQYAMVAYYDTDTQLTGRGIDPLLPLRCAAKGNFLSTAGASSPFNIGFFALKPSKALLNAAVNFAETADYTRFTGWGGAGNAPSRGHFFGAECGQGFMHAFLFKKTTLLTDAYAKAGIEPPQAAQIDRCVWNYQHDKKCYNGDVCGNAVLIHKDDPECMKKGPKHDWQSEAYKAEQNKKRLAWQAHKKFLAEHPTEHQK